MAFPHLNQRRGRGMTSDQIAKIGAFQQFERERYEQQGLGLGLLLVQKLIRQYDAKLEITSDPGEWTRVRIAFPGVKPVDASLNVDLSTAAGISYTP